MLGDTLLVYSFVAMLFISALLRLLTKLSVISLFVSWKEMVYLPQSQGPPNRWVAGTREKPGPCLGE